MAKIANTDEVSEGTLTKVAHEGTTYLLTKVGDDYYAIENSCPHLGMSMANGKVSDGAITCPWHGSRFDACTGANLDWVSGFAGIKTPKWTHKLIGMGKQPAPAKTHKLTVEGAELHLARG